MDSDEWVVALVGHGLKIARDAALACIMRELSDGAADPVN